MDMQGAIRALTEGRDLSAAEMEAAMRIVMTGEATQAQIGGFLIALRMKGETVAEIAAAAKVMRELATAVHVTGDHIIDIVGTGGDGANIFNVSTAAALVVALVVPLRVAGAQAVEGRRLSHRGEAPAPLLCPTRDLHLPHRLRKDVRSEANRPLNRFGLLRIGRVA